MKDKYGMLIELVENESKILCSKVRIPSDSDYKLYIKAIEADIMDITEYDDNYDIVVDDEGLMISNNPVFEIDAPIGKIQLAGKLLFLKSIETEYGIENEGMDVDEVELLMNSMNGKLKLLGLVK